MEQYTLEQEEKIFTSITAFINDLFSEFGTKYKPVSLYHHLIQKTLEMPKDDESVRTCRLKHVSAFKKFIEENKQAIISGETFTKESPRIVYSDKVYIDMAHIFEHFSDDEEGKDIVRRHILVIWKLIDPDSEAKTLLVKNDKVRSEIMAQIGDGSEESNFLTNIIEKVESGVAASSSTDEKNPMASIGNLLQSGVITDLITGMTQGISSGKLDINKLMGTVNGLVNKLSPDGMPPELNGIMGMMPGLMASQNIPTNTKQSKPSSKSKNKK